jgi:hypothetical protein
MQSQGGWEPATRASAAHRALFDTLKVGDARDVTGSCGLLYMISAKACSGNADADGTNGPPRVAGMLSCGVLITR